MRVLLFSCCLCFWLAFALTARAQLSELPLSLAQAALSEQVPGAFAPSDFEVEDFELVPVHGNDATIRARLVPGSLRWVRVGNLLRVPRALLIVETQPIDAGSVAHAGFTHPMLRNEQGGRAEVPVALLSTEGASVQVETFRSGRRATAAFAIRFRPRPAHAGHVSFDSNCSPYGVSVRDGHIPAGSWLQVSCRVVRTANGDRTSSTLELYLLWDHVGGVIEVNSVPLKANASGVFMQRLNAKPGEITLSAEEAALTLRYFISDPFHAAFAGAGLGPALYTFEGPGKSVQTVAPLLTLYAGFAFDSATRLVYFSALAAHERGYLGQGLYLWVEQFRAFDERLSMNLLLGANLLMYRRGKNVVSRISAPQGVELIVRDLLAVNRNLTVGAFLYPDISGSAYYDGWIRWGSPRFFGELNFLYWREPHSSGTTRSQTLGLSFGMPLLRFL